MIRFLTSHDKRGQAEPPSSEPSRPLVVTSDDAVLDNVLKLAAAARIDVSVAHDTGSARARWKEAPLVVVGADQAEAISRQTLDRRSGVYLVSCEPGDTSTWRHAVAMGAEQVLFFPDDEAWLTDRFADSAEGEGNEALVVGVIGGRGGAGASVLAASLALTARRQGKTVTLIDTDPLGGGLDLTLGAESAIGLRWPDFAASKGRLSAQALRTELPGHDGLVLLSWDRGEPIDVPLDAAVAVLAAASRTGELVIVDLPRSLTQVAQEAAALCSCVLLVVPLEVRAVASAARVCANISTIAQDVRVVARGPSTSGLTATETASSLGLPLLTEISAEPRLMEQLDRGQAPGSNQKGPLAVGCAEILTNVSDRLATRVGAGV